MARPGRQAPSAARDLQLPRLECAEKRSADRGCVGGAQFGVLLKIRPRRAGAAQRAALREEEI